MAQYGLGNYLYELEVKDGTANFHFVDPEDASNTADVTVSQKDFPEGAPADSRQVADVAYAQAAKVLNDKRDARVKKDAAKDLDDRLTEEARSREAADDFLANSSHVAVEPAKVESDGTKVYNTEDKSSDKTADDKKK
jgi:hypothetical protein